MPETAAMDGACATTAGATPARTGGGDYENTPGTKEGASLTPLAMVASNGSRAFARYRGRSTSIAVSRADFIAAIVRDDHMDMPSTFPA
jgi:hypothetical protein